MFDKIKQLGKLKQLQDEIAKERFEIEKDGTKIIMNGKMEVIEINLPENIVRENQEKVLKDLFNDAVKKTQQAAIKRMSGMGGLGF